MRVHRPVKRGRCRAVAVAIAVAFVTSFGTLWLGSPPASAGLVTGEIPASVQMVDVQTVDVTGAATGHGRATSAGPDAGVTARSAGGNPEEGAPPEHPRAAVLGGFLAANAVVMLTAGVLRYGKSATLGHRRARRQPRPTR